MFRTINGCVDVPKPWWNSSFAVSVEYMENESHNFTQILNNLQIPDNKIFFFFFFFFIEEKKIGTYFKYALY